MSHTTSEDTTPPLPKGRPPAALGAGQAAEDRARMFLEAIGHDDHPLAADDPIYALFQVAVDYRCVAQGYEGLLRRHRATSAEK